MEDAATAEISRAPGVAVGAPRRKLADGRTVTPELVRELEDEELERIRARDRRRRLVPAARDGRASRATLFEQVALADEFVEFLTLPAYERLED